MLTDSDTAAPWLEGLAALAPLIAELSVDFDRARQIPDQVFDALAGAGLFRLWLPKSLGGPELCPLAFMRVVEAASALDGSVGWLVGNGGGMSRIGGYLPAGVVRDWFANMRCFVVSCTGSIGSATPVEGGYRVTGRWSFGSGAPHATHFMGLASIGGSKAADVPRICCHLERQQIELHDTWHVSGLRGTGSWDFEARDVFVPTSRTHPFPEFAPVERGLLYRLPANTIYPWTVSVVPLGIARGAIDAFARLAATRSRQGSAGPIRNSEIAQSMMGRAETLHDAGRALLIAAMTELMAAMDVGADRLVEARIRLRTACANAAESTLRILDMLAAEAGTSAIFENGPLERKIRDGQAAAKHVAMNPASYLALGRHKLGVD